MRAIQTRIYLCTLFPILLLPCMFWFHVTDAALTLQPPSLSLLLLLILIGWGWLINLYIKKKVVEPIIELNQRLEEPETKLMPNMYAKDTIIQSLLVKLQNRASALKDDLQQSEAAALAQQLAYKENKEVLEERIQTLLGHVTDLQTQSDITTNYYQTLARLTQHPLQATINSTRSLMQRSSSEQAQKYRIELMRGSDNLQFLFGQIYACDNPHRQQRSLSTLTESGQQDLLPIDLHELVDSVISLIAPIIEQEIAPIFDQSCHFQPVACKTEIRQLLFHTLLSHFTAGYSLTRQHRPSPTRTTHYTSQASADGLTSKKHRAVVLKIQVKSRKILFLVADNRPIAVTPKLRELLQVSKAHITGKVLAITSQASTSSNPLVDNPHSYRIFSSDQKQHASLSSRLKNIGMKVSQDPAKAEVAFILHQKSKDIQLALTRLHHATTVYFLEHELIFQHSHWHQLTYPIYQSDLLRSLKQLSKPAHQQLALVVDDSAQNRKVLCQFILAIGHRVIESGMPTEAVKLVTRHQPDVIFTDLHMPILSGAGFSRKVRENGYEGRIYCVTAQVPEEASSTILESGFSQLITKPIGMKQLASIFSHQHKRPNKVDANAVTSSDMTNSKVFDHALSLTRTNDNSELMRDLLQILIDTLPEDILAIRKHLAEKDIKKLKLRLHKLIGALRYCGVPRLTQAVLHLDKLAKEPVDTGQKQIEPEKLDEGLMQLEEEFQALNTWYERQAEHLTSIQR
jgi:CheY-like chemotaxis protein